MISSRAERLQKSMTCEPAADGKTANLFVLNNAQGMSVTLMDIGATWLSCEIPIDSEMREMVLGGRSMADYKRQQVYLGATVGRFANRIAQGKFAIEGIPYQLQTNQGGNTLHGGPEGFDRRRWNAVQENDRLVIFTLVSIDGDQGFPGNLQVTVSYQLSEDNELSIDYRAITDKACPVNLTNHSYFNLMGKGSKQDCLTHKLMIKADHYLPTDEKGIPIGHFRAVKGSSFDFTQLKEIGRDFLSENDQRMAGGYDHAFILEKAAQNGQVAATVIAPDGKVRLEVRTNKPAIQFYTGNFLAGTPDRSGGEYQNQAAFALETQFLPDSVNHLEWDLPSPVLLADKLYAYQTAYKFIINHSDID